MKPKLLFLTLNVFSATGGIEKVCRVAGKALHELAEEGGGELAVYAMHDKDSHADEAYFPASAYQGFGGKKLAFALAAVRAGCSADTVLLSHVNLLPVGYAIKKLSPKTKLVLMAHGIEVWDPVASLKQRLFAAVDLFLPVSSFTAKKLESIHKISSQKIQVLNNCLDPFLRKEGGAEAVTALRKRYGIKAADFVLLTLTRIKFSEQYKGYDKVITALTLVRQDYPNVKYLIAGKYDAEEKQRLDVLISENGLHDAVIFTGFVRDDELSAHFGAADAYIMPSTGEGFGIVFIEALFYGLPVIAGNVDGSVDALAGGEFGLLVNPGKEEEIINAIKLVANDSDSGKPALEKVLQRFGFAAYKQNWRNVICPKRIPNGAVKVNVSNGRFASRQ